MHAEVLARDVSRRLRVVHTGTVLFERIQSTRCGPRELERSKYQPHPSLMQSKPISVSNVALSNLLIA